MIDIERITARVGQRVMSQGRATYEGARVPNGRAEGITAVLDRDYELFDEDQVAIRVSVMSIEVQQVPESQQGDVIIRPGERWTVGPTIEDDGHMRVVRVFPRR